MNNSEFYPHWTCGLRLMEILKRIVDQHLVMNLKLGNFLIQYVFYKDYTRTKEIFFLLLFSIQNISVCFLLMGSLSWYISLYYLLLLYDVISLYFS